LRQSEERAGQRAGPRRGGGSPRPCPRRVRGWEDLGRGEGGAGGGAEVSKKGGRLGLGGWGGGGCQVQLWCRPGGRPLHLSQPGGNVIGNRGRLRADLEIGEGRPVSRRDYNTRVERAARVVRLLQLPEQRGHLRAVEPLQ